MHSQQSRDESERLSEFPEGDTEKGVERKAGQLTGEHAAVAFIRHCVHVGREVPPHLSAVHSHVVIAVNRKQLVRIDYDAEETRKGLRA